METLTVETLTAAAVSISAHFFFSPIPEVSTLTYLATYFAGNTLLLAYLAASPNFISQLLLRLVTLNITFLLTATCVTLTRRLFFSPLSHFPGPRVAALSRVWEAKEFGKGTFSFTVQALHKVHNSDIIRTGPNDLSISNVDAVEKIYKGKYKRGPFYEMGSMMGVPNVNTTRDYAQHGPWRRIWNNAFTPIELKQYNPRVEHHVAKLVQLIRGFQGKEFNFSKVMDNFVFDVMADLGFAEDSNLQDGTGDSTYPDFLHKYVAMIGVMGALSNISQIAKYLPQNKDVRTFRLKGEALMSKRKAMGASRKDIFTHLLSVDPSSGHGFNTAQLNANAQAVVTAGADTTSHALTQALRVLVFDQESKNKSGSASCLSKIRSEVDTIVAKNQETNLESIKNAKYVDGVVCETLRLKNPVPSGIQAVTPPQGLEVAGIRIPGNVNVRVPHLTLMTDERYFPSAAEFIPERWTGDRPELLTDESRRAYIPFSYGVHNCVGKNLALNEMRLVLARLAAEFDVSFGESHSDEKFEIECKDYMILESGALWLKFQPRF